MGAAEIKVPFHGDFIHNFRARVVGRKRIKLVPLPTRRRWRTICTAIRKWTVALHSERFPSRRHAHSVERMQAPGESLFLPIG